MVDIIEECVDLVRDEDNNTLTFFQGPKSLQNAKSNATFPVFFLDSPMESEGEFLKTGLIDDVYQVSFFIGYNTKLNDKYPALQEAVDKARYCVDRFVTKLSRHADVAAVIGPVRKTDVIHLFDQDISGCFAEVKCKPLKRTQKIC